MEKRYLTKSELTLYLRTGRIAIEEWIAAGFLTPIYLPRHNEDGLKPLFDRLDVDSWVSLCKGPLEATPASLGVTRTMRKFRLAKGLSMEDMANDLGISRSAYRKYETGETVEVPKDRLVRIAQILNVKPGELLAPTKKGR